ncbi:hypothetical protein [Chryseobacterium gregarium]|uniref:hypothetical protein n=1 Tax=Chryseobacterium gregarium TaxID=456299 RepID=UPI000489BBF9|nr:hypothetical protein [Chryseobacterium gregarium]
MESLKLKGIIIIMISFLGVIFFGFTWISPHYNDIGNYNFLNNNYGQFAFSAFLVNFIYNLLKYIKKENLFIIFIIISFTLIGITFLTTKIFLWPFAIVLLMSLIFNYVRKWM